MRLLRAIVASLVVVLAAGCQTTPRSDWYDLVQTPQQITKDKTKVSFYTEKGKKPNRTKTIEVDEETVTLKNKKVYLEKVIESGEIVYQPVAPGPQ